MKIKIDIEFHLFGDGTKTENRKSVIGPQEKKILECVICGSQIIDSHRTKTCSQDCAIEYDRVRKRKKINNFEDIEEGNVFQIK